MAMTVEKLTENLFRSYEQIAANTTITFACTPGVPFRLRGILFHASVAPGGANVLTLSVDSGLGATYDVVLDTQDMNGLTDYTFPRNASGCLTEPLFLDGTDAIDLVMASVITTGITTLQVLWSPAQEGA